MEQQFYLAINGAQTGPFTIDELKIKNIQKETLVWTEGLGDWTKADHIPLLKEIIKETPPPIFNAQQGSQKEQTAPPENKTTLPLNKYFGYELAQRRERLFAVIIENIVIGIPLGLIFAEEINNSIIPWILLSAVLGAFFYPKWSGSLGHKIMGLKVISSTDGSDVNSAKNGAIRESLKSVLSIVFIPVVWLLWDDDRQNVYDKIVNTYVVRKK